MLEDGARLTDSWRRTSDVWGCRITELQRAALQMARTRALPPGWSGAEAGCVSTLVKILDTGPDLKLALVQAHSRILELLFNSRSGTMHLIGVYVPYDEHPEEVTTIFWTQLESLLQTTPLSEPVFVMGNFNARLQGRFNKEKEMHGPHVNGKG